MRLTMKITLLTWLGIVLSCSGVHADVDKLRVVGTWSSLTLFKNFEKPFWTETVPQELGIETTMTSLGQVKLKGPAVVRQMDMGVFDVVHTVADYIVSDSPDLSGLDLPGVTTDIATAKKTVEAYRPALEEYLARDFNVKLLSVVPYPAQVLFCRVEIGGLDDLKGKKNPRLRLDHLRIRHRAWRHRRYHVIQRSTAVASARRGGLWNYRVTLGLFGGMG